MARETPPPKNRAWPAQAAALPHPDVRCNRLSLSTTSEQVRQLQAESDAEGRSVASLVREAIDELPSPAAESGGESINEPP